MADNIVFISGEGYSISRGSNGEVSFTGSLLVDDVVKTVLPNKWNLIGNPFTAFLPMNKNSNSNFINENFTKLNDANKGIYLWDNSQNKYAVSTLIDETQRALAPGQGFFIRPKEGVNNITFKENQRIIQPSSNNEFNKSNSGSPSIELLLSDKIYTVKTAIKFFDNATRGFDPGYDIGNFNSSFDVFTKLVSGDNKEYFTIQSLKTNDFNDLEIPIGVNAKANTELSFALNLINIPNSVTLTLEDRVNNEFFTFNSETSKFTRTISSDLNGFGQFYLHITEAKSLGIATDEKNGVQIYLRNNNILAVKGLSLNKNDLHIYDLHGKRVFNTKLLKQNNSEIQIPQLSKGVYLVKIKNKLGMTDKKIVIK